MILAALSVTCTERIGYSAHAKASATENPAGLILFHSCRPSSPGDLHTSLSHTLLISPGKRSGNGTTRSLWRGMAVFCFSSPRMKWKNSCVTVSPRQVALLPTSSKSPACINMGTCWTFPPRAVADALFWNLLRITLWKESL